MRQIPVSCHLDGVIEVRITCKVLSVPPIFGAAFMPGKMFLKVYIHFLTPVG